MKIAFYAPLKSPRHPVPSGDRLMARLVMKALAAAGHEVELVSELRSFAREPAGHAALGDEIAGERERIRRLWSERGAPELWFTYHVYYKAPDFLGPGLSAEVSIPYVTMEASWSRRRNDEGWGAAQDGVLDAVRRACLNICLTARDEAGLQAALADARTVRLPPFIEAPDLLEIAPAPEAGRLLAVAMMRPGDKLESYRQLAEALRRVERPFTLEVAGDGLCRAEVEAMLTTAAPGKVRFAGALDRQALAESLRRASILVWPGVGEAYGMAYLEASAAAVPVIAFRNGGVPEVVEEGVSGLLVPPGDAPAFAVAIDRLLADGGLRERLSAGGRQMVLSCRGIEQAAAQLGRWMEDCVREMHR